MTGTKQSTREDYVSVDELVRVSALRTANADLALPAATLGEAATQLDAMHRPSADKMEAVPAFGLPGPFQPATYTFTLDAMTITNTRSRHNDSDKVTASLAVGTNPPQQLTKDMGDCNNGLHPIGLTFDPVTVSDPTTPVVFNYAIVNAGGDHKDALMNTIHTELNNLAQEGAKKLADLAAQGINSLVGVPLGTALLPVIGSAVGALANWVVQEVWNVLLFPDCDGPVAFEQAAYNGDALWRLTSLLDPWPVSTQHAGVQSADGCGSNSQYGTAFLIRR
jgi:hypothetical protein